MKILAVDDERDIVDLIKITLEREGHSVIPAYSGKEALDMLNNEAVDLVLLDIMMPEMSGLEVVDAIRREEKLKELPIIMVTVKKGFDDIEKGYRLGVNDYIAKPFSRDILIKCIKEISGLERKEGTVARKLPKIESGVFEALFYRNPDGVVLVDDEEGIVAVNPALEALIGWKSKELVGRMTCTELFTCHDPDGNRLMETECLRALYAPEHASYSEFYITSKQGVDIPVGAYVFRLHMEGLSAIFLRNLSKNRVKHAEVAPI
ncbi:MAG: response regulator [Candidatus Hydrothermarchaeales archaeon]